MLDEKDPKSSPFRHGGMFSKSRIDESRFDDVVEVQLGVRVRVLATRRLEREELEHKGLELLIVIGDEMHVPLSLRKESVVKGKKKRRRQGRQGRTGETQKSMVAMKSYWL